MEELFIVNLNKIDIIERDRITILDKKIPLAESYRNTFNQMTKG